MNDVALFLPIYVHRPTSSSSTATLKTLLSLWISAGMHTVSRVFCVHVAHSPCVLLTASHSLTSEDDDDAVHFEGRIQLNLFMSLVYNSLGVPLGAGLFYAATRPTTLPPAIAAIASLHFSASCLPLQLCQQRDRCLRSCCLRCLLPDVTLLFWMQAMALSSVSVVLSSLALNLYVRKSAQNLDMPRVNRNTCKQNLNKFWYQTCCPRADGAPSRTKVAQALGSRERKKRHADATASSDSDVESSNKKPVSNPVEYCRMDVEGDPDMCDCPADRCTCRCVWCMMCCC